MDPKRNLSYTLHAVVFGDDIIGCSRQASQMKMFISGNVFSIMNRTLEKTPSGKEYYKCSDRILKCNISPFKYVDYDRNDQPTKRPTDSPGHAEDTVLSNT